MFLLDLYPISQTLFCRSWFPRSLQSLFLLLLLEAIPLESDTCVFPIELAFKASESWCIWKPQHSPLPLNWVFQDSSHIPHPTQPSGSQYFLSCPWKWPAPAGACPLKKASHQQSKPQENPRLQLLTARASTNRLYDANRKASSKVVSSYRSYQKF